jgi:hypothetical protein
MQRNTDDAPHMTEVYDDPGEIKHTHKHMQHVETTTTAHMADLHRAHVASAFASVICVCPTLCSSMSLMIAFAAADDMGGRCNVSAVHAAMASG